MDLPDPEDFIMLLSRHHVPSLKCVFLNGCKTDVLAERIVKAVPTRHLQVICWGSVTEDKAACCFARGFYTAIGCSQRNSTVSIESAYEAAAKSFQQSGYRCGDPEPYLMSGNRQPPVHGKHLLIKSQ